jgi:Uma2 family endonuclease
MVWIVDSRRKTVTVHRELLSPREVAGEGRLEGEDVVPGFSVSLPDIFES